MPQPGGYKQRVNDGTNENGCLMADLSADGRNQGKNVKPTQGFLARNFMGIDQPPARSQLRLQTYDFLCQRAN
ncbi:hypothetical protein [Spirosoma areae]